MDFEALRSSELSITHGIRWQSRVFPYWRTTLTGAVRFARLVAPEAGLGPSVIEVATRQVG